MFHLSLAFLTTLVLQHCDAQVLAPTVNATVKGNLVRRDQRASDAGNDLQRNKEPFAALFQAKPSGTALQTNYPFYHSSADIRRHVRRLAGHGNCRDAALTLRTKRDGDVAIDVINVKSSQLATPKNKIFVVAGEHARELIGPETVLYFLRALCGDGDAEFVERNPASSLLELSGELPTAASVLAKSEFEIVINANPDSRKRVENGEYCLRANPNNVDLNRNWGDHWEPAASSGDTGSTAFSEPEARLVRDAVTSFKPTAFLSVHSGTLGMYMPWAYSLDRLASKNQAGMLHILEALDEKHCWCPYGAAGKEVGYACPGTSVDYVYDKLNVPYSFAWEIYGGSSSELQSRWKSIQASSPKMLLQTEASAALNLNDPFFRNFFSQYPSDFVGLSLRAGGRQMDTDYSDEEVEGCMMAFNPSDETSYNETVQNWAGAYADMAIALSIVQDSRAGHGKK